MCRVASIKSILMHRDKLSESEADEAIDDARQEVTLLIENDDYDNLIKVCPHHFGLSSDYLYELIPELLKMEN